ncbi:MAG: T9SS type A sorting domain-containing protein [bacterium]|nr:T9SS type A sorting domain-containing protein [bacterium]
MLQILPNNLLLARIDTTGQAVQPVGVIYESNLGTNIADADVTITDDGKVVVVWSEVSDWNDGPRTMWIAWTDWHEFLDTPNEELPALPHEISLSSYPNPFNSTVTIKYDLPQAGHAKLTAYDLQGRVVATLFDDFAPAGSTELHWSPENLASGVYFLNLEAPLANATHKILYLK